jgi:excisionase family DNA binding protein
MLLETLVYRNLFIDKYFIRIYFCGMGKLLSTTEVAERLGISVPRIQTFIWEGRLPAQRVGRSYAIDEDDLKLVENRKVGRPPKAKTGAASGQDGRVVVTKKRGGKK